MFIMVSGSAPKYLFAYYMLLLQKGREPHVLHDLKVETCVGELGVQRGRAGVAARAALDEQKYTSGIFFASRYFSAFGEYPHLRANFNRKVCAWKGLLSSTPALQPQAPASATGSTPAVECWPRLKAVAPPRTRA
jgi:hypothetical protein